MNKTLPCGNNTTKRDHTSLEHSLLDHGQNPLDVGQIALVHGRLGNRHLLFIGITDRSLILLLLLLLKLRLDPHFVDAVVDIMSGAQDAFEMDQIVVGIVWLDHVALTSLTTIVV